MGKQFKMKEITQYTGANKSTILYYLSLGLLPEPVKTSKNMAYYPSSYIDIIPVIQYLQDMYLPLGIIKRIFDDVGFERVSTENAVHYYETFLSPIRHGESPAVYDGHEFEKHSDMEADEIHELENRGLLFPLDSGLFSDNDLLAAGAYRKLKDLGISFSKIEGLTGTVKKLAYEVHELYHDNAAELDRDREQGLTNVMRKEFDTVFGYLISNYLLVIYKEENK